MSATAPAAISASDARQGITSACPAYCASRPESSGPRPRPPRFAAVATISLRVCPAPGRAAACSSLRYAVAVAVSMPMLTPATTRATIRPAVAGQARNAAPCTRLSLERIAHVNGYP